MVSVRKDAHDFLMAPERDGATVERIEAEACTTELLRDRAGGISLFGGREVTLIDTPSESAEALETLLENAALLGESLNWFVVIEGKLKAADKKTLQKHANEFFECAEAKKEERFNVFSLTDALLRRDKKSLWVLLRRAQLAGLTSEEIIGTLFWQIKTMRLAARAASPAEADLKPFVYNKAKSGLSKYREGEVDELSRKLVAVYHDGHLGKTDIDNALERFVLSI